MTKRYITTAIPYMNGNPHIGHAVDYCLADTAARYFRLLGDEVRFQAGTDEHGNKIFQKASDLGIPVEEYVADNAKKFREFIEKLDASYTDFIRTTQEDHKQFVQEVIKKIAAKKEENSDIYEGKYQGLY